MRITLYEAFADPYRESMLVYGRFLASALEKEKNNGDFVRSYLPSWAALNPAPARYACQYLGYPAAAFFNQGDVNHILDHSYAHLTHALKAERTVVTFHDAIWLKFRPRLGLAQLHNLSGLKKAGRIVCDSSASRKALLEYLNYPAEKVEVVPLGLGDDFQTAQNVPRFPGLLEGIYLLHAGHTQSYKNIPALFQVLSILKSWGKPVKLLKVGTEFSPEQIASARQLGVWDEVVHLGKVSRAQLPSVYKSARVLLHPSLDEGFGITLLEAMAMGLPIVCSNRGSLPEIAGDAAILTEPDDYLAMAKAVCGILENDGLRVNLVHEGRKQVSKFTWQNTARKMLEIYRQVSNS